MMFSVLDKILRCIRAIVSRLRVWRQHVSSKQRLSTVISHQTDKMHYASALHAMASESVLTHVETRSNSNELLRDTLAETLRRLGGARR